MTDNKKNPEHRDYAVMFNYEFLDDVYANWSEKGASEVGSGSGMLIYYVQYTVEPVYNLTHQGTREMCRIVDDVGILRFYLVNRNALEP